MSRDAGGVIDGFIVATSIGVLLWVFFVEPTAFDNSLPSVRAGDQRCLPCRRSAADRDRRATGGSAGQATGALLDLGRQSARTARRRSRLPLSISIRRVQRNAIAVDFGWWISYALVVAVLLHPQVGEIAAAPSRSTPSLSRRRILLLSLVTMAAPLTIAARSAAGASLQLPVLLGGTVVLFGLVVVRLVAMARELEHSRTLLLHEATHDALTGLGNRTLFSDQVERALANDVPVAVLCLDLDDFKVVNDSLGHPAGDVVLQVVGERLLGLMRPGDAVARLGGDEFAMMVTGPDSATGAAVAERALAAVCQAIGSRTVRPCTATSRSASPTAATTAPSKRCCATPTSPCTSPSNRARVITRCSKSGCAKR